MRRLLSVAVLVGACASEPPTGPLPPATLSVVMGGDLDLLPDGAPLVDELAVKVLDRDGNPVKGVSVTFAQDAPGGVIEPEVATTDAAGIARATWRLTGVPGEWRASARNLEFGAVDFSARLRGTRVAALAMNQGRMCVLDDAGKLACWVEGTGAAHPRPVPVATGATFTKLFTEDYSIIAAGPICALSTTGQVWCSQSNNQEDWPTGMPGDRSPVEFVAEAATHPPLRSAGLFGNRTICGLGVDDQVWCWGGGNYGARGDGTVAPDATTLAARIQAPEEIRFESLATGGTMACALADDGAPWCWGENWHGSVIPDQADGVIAVPHRVTVPQPLAKVEVNGDQGVCGLTELGRPICWGARTSRGQAVLSPLGTPFAPSSVSWPGTVADLIPASSGFVGVDGGRLITWGTMPEGNSLPVSAPSEVPTMAAIRAARVHAAPLTSQTVCFDLAVQGQTVCARKELLFDRPGGTWGNLTLLTSPLIGIPTPLPVDSIGT